MANILLVRHGENNWVKKKRLAGWLPNVHLNENGRKQAQEAAERLAGLPIKAVYSSPLTRCQETAVPIAQSHQLIISELPGMGEVRYGQWEGKKIKKLAKDPLWHGVQHYPSRFRFPEGESMAEVQFRAITTLEEVAQRHPQEMVVIVSHADVIKLVVAYYLGVHIDLFQRIVISPASVTMLALTAAGGVHILRVNDDGPIQPPPPPKEPKEGVEDATKNGQKKKKKALVGDEGASLDRAASTTAIEKEKL